MVVLIVYILVTICAEILFLDTIERIAHCDAIQINIVWLNVCVCVFSLISSICVTAVCLKNYCKLQLQYSYAVKTNEVKKLFYL